jgi:ribosomal protein L11 methyltransferase
VTPTTWTSVRVHAAGNRAAVISALFELGAEGVQELPEEIVTHLRRADETIVTRAIRRADSGAEVAFAPTPDVDWSAAWKSRITAHRLARLVVTPPWLAARYGESERIVIDPGMAFGTGEHETTRGVIRLMQCVVRDNDVVADIGAGSAVLGIAAAKLGARRVIAIEIDPDAIGNAEDNVARNGVSDRISIIEGDARVLLPLAAPVRVVFANIVSSVLLDLLPVIAGALTPDGAAILSGILVDERPEMERAFGRAGWRMVDADHEGSWWSVTLERA